MQNTADIVHHGNKSVADGNAPAATASNRPVHKAGELIVQFKDGLSDAGRASVLVQVGGRALEQIGTGDGGPLRIGIGNGLSVEQAIQILSNLPQVRFAEPNYVLREEALANDPSFVTGEQWGMEGAATTHPNAFGSNAAQAWTAGHVGSTGVAVGVVDSGVDYTHPDLYLNIWLNPGEISPELRSQLIDTDGDGRITFRDLNAPANVATVKDLNGNGRIDAGDLLSDARWENGSDQDGNGFIDDLIGWDFANNDNDPLDDRTHGTHVAGTIAATGGNGVGVAGVGWATQIVPLKFIDVGGTGLTSNALKALDYFHWAAAHPQGTRFVATNNSWGGGGFSQAVLDSIVEGARAGVLFVAAAGNGGDDSLGDNLDAAPRYPSSYDTRSAIGWDAVIGVASLTASGALSSFSNYGEMSVELAAPGSSILSTVPGGYALKSGTSMSAAFVSGAIAVRAALGDADALQIRSDLLASVAATASLAGVTLSGGRLDAARMLPAAAPAEPIVTYIYGTAQSGTVTGTTGADVISGLPETGTTMGKGTIDRLVGNGGEDLFVLGDPRGRFYDDGKARSAGTSDYAVLSDFGAGDRIQLFGTQSQYLQNAVRLDQVSGIGIYHDSNSNGRFDSSDELIGIVSGAQQALDWSVFDFI